MLLSIRHLLSFWLLVFSTPLTSTSALVAPNSSHGPDLDAARRNAFHIFNVIHSAMRQWGSSVNHNGVSFFLATVPEGNLFYHGRSSPDRPDSFEWLAFEVEHASGFALSGDPRMPPPGLPRPTNKPDIFSWQPSYSEISGTQMSPTQESHVTEDSSAQNRLIEDDDRGKHSPPPTSRGYFQTYRASRPLKLIYIDGMGAAKGCWGTTDSQDLLLLGLSRNFTDGPRLGDTVYGRLLCELAKEWGVDGWVRMEAGFEIIYCDFASGGGLEFVSQHGSAFPNETENSQWEVKTLLFELLRAAAKRYDGFSSGRIRIDWSSMVTAYAYDVNTTNPNLERQDLPRLIEVTKEEKEDIRAQFREVIMSRKHGVNPMIDWQNIVDDIVTRFSDRLNFITHGNLSVEMLWGEVSTLLNPFLNFPEDRNASTPSPIGVTLCTNHYLNAAIMRRDSWTLEDTANFIAVKVVADKICSSLFQIRTLLSSAQVGEESALLKSRKIAGTLMDQLQWTTWKGCGRCASSWQFCFIPMFPTGSVEDYYSPNCKGLDDMDDVVKGCYWAGVVPC
jgi:hypothetical protein